MHIFVTEHTEHTIEGIFAYSAVYFVSKYATNYAFEFH